MKQKILLIHNYYKIPGGEDTVVANEKKMLEEHGHTVVLYTRSNLELDGLPLWKKILLPGEMLFSVRTYREVRRVIREHKIDIVHVHNTLSLISPSVFYAARSCGVPVVQTLHNFRMLCPAATFLRDNQICEACLTQGLQCAVKHACYRGSKIQSLMSALILKAHRLLGTYKRVHYICLTEFNRGKLLELNRGGKKQIPEEHVWVKPNFVKAETQSNSIRKEQYVFVGRLEKLKGIHVLMQAWRNFPEKRLILCGTGPEEGWIREYVKAHGMAQVEVRGQMERKEVLKLLAESKALVLPTMCYEGQPMSILESFSVGTPVVASDVGNAGAMVTPGKTGERFVCGDPKDLCQAVKKLEETGAYDTRTAYKTNYEDAGNYVLLSEIYRKIQEQNE